MAWVGNSTSLHFVFSELITQTANHSTVENCRAVEPGCLYYFNAEDSFNNVLFKDCYASSVRHAFVAKGTSSASGIVVLGCTSDNPLVSSEGHSPWIPGMLFDNFRDLGTLHPREKGRVLVFYNRGHYGSHGWTGAHIVIWNSDMGRRKGKPGKAVQRLRTAKIMPLGPLATFQGMVPFRG